MAKVRHTVVQVIPHHFVNNLYLGGPQGPTEEHLALLKKYLASKPAQEAKAVSITGYVAQKDYVGPTDPENPPNVTPLPTVATDITVGGYPTACTTNTDAANLLAALGDFVGDAEEGKMWSGYDAEGGYLQSFERDASNYATQSRYFPANRTGEGDDAVYTKVPGSKPISKPLENGKDYIWEGWGVMYNPGAGVPTSSAYGASDGYTLTLMADEDLSVNKVFTFVYAQTSYGFTYEEKGLKIHHKTVIEEIEEDVEAFLAKAKEDFEKVEAGIAHLFEKIAD